MKILIATDTYYPHVNGCSYFGQRLAYYLKKRGHEILVIAPSKDIHNGNYKHQGVNIYGVRSIPLYYNNFTFSPPWFIKTSIRQTIEKFKPDVVHFQGHFFISKVVLSVAKELSIPIVGTNHFMPENLVHYLHLPIKLERYIEQKSWKQFREIFEQLQVITSPTQTAANLVYKMGFSKNVLPISNGIDRERFNPHKDGAYLRKRYAIPDVPTMLYVGRLDKEKNIDLLLRAFALVSNEIDVHFVVGGSGVNKNSLEVLSHKLGLQNKVTFVGFVPDDDLPSLYRLADCFVIAGIAELQSIVTMEAMASGLPVIGVDAVALPELVHHGENGFLFKHGDIVAMAEYMREMFSDKQKRMTMAQKSLEIIERHDIRKTLEQFEAVYQTAIKNLKQ